MQPSTETILIAQVVPTWLTTPTVATALVLEEMSSGALNSLPVVHNNGSRMMLEYSLASITYLVWRNFDDKLPNVKMEEYTSL